MGIKGIRVLQIKTPVMFQAGLRCVLLVLPACLAGCTGGTALEQTPMVGLQITEYTDKMAFYRITDELRVRNITATILVNDTFAADNPYLIRQLDDEGCEIMVFARPTQADGSSTTMSKLTYEEQYAFVSQLKSGVEAVLGKPVTGFQCTQFDENADTYKVVNELGFQYNLGFVAESSQNIPGHEDAILPYQVDDYGFWAVPMHCAEWEGERQAFCDNSFADLTAEEWESLLKSELDRMDTADQPLLVEFHSYQTGVDEGRFQAFVHFLDYAVSKGVRFITTTEYLE